MKAKKFVSMLVLIAAICISSPYAMKAGGPPPPNVVTGTSLRGTVKFEGAGPKPKLISMAADPSCAKQHPSPVFSQEVVTDSKGDLQNVVVFVAEGLGDRTFNAPRQPVVV